MATEIRVGSHVVTKETETRSRFSWTVDRKFLYACIQNSGMDKTFNSPVYKVGLPGRVQKWSLRLVPHGTGVDRQLSVMVHSVANLAMEHCEVSFVLSVRKDGHATVKSEESRRLGYGTFARGKTGVKDLISIAELKEDVENMHVTIACDVRIFLMASKHVGTNDVLGYSSADIHEEMVGHFGAMRSMLHLSDVNLLCGDQTLMCHKLVLSARSSVFRSMFASKSHLEVTSGEVRIVDMDVKVLKDLIEYMYTGSPPKDLEDSAGEVLAAADRYNIQGLVEVCQVELVRGMDQGNALETLSILDRQGGNMKYREIAFRYVLESLALLKKLPAWTTFAARHGEILNELLERAVGPAVAEPMDGE